MDLDTGPIILSTLAGLLTGDIVGSVRIKLEERKWGSDDDGPDA